MNTTGLMLTDPKAAQTDTAPPGGTHQEEQFAGYNVRYVYAGATYNTVMPQDPGQTMRVRVHVRPAQ